MTAAIVIAWRDSGNANRQANLTAVLDWLAPLGWPLILASDGRESGPFNRSAAYNEGVRIARRDGADPDVFVWHEADVLCPLDQLDDAVALAEKQMGLMVPFTHYRYMGEESSRLILSGARPETMFPQWVMDNGRSMGALGVCSAESLAAIGRWDETLSGHGFDDNAMFEAFRTACGPSTFVDGDLTHLYHPMAYAPWEKGTPASDPDNFSPEEVKATFYNRARWDAYKRATTAEQVRALTMEDA